MTYRLDTPPVYYICYVLFSAKDALHAFICCYLPQDPVFACRILINMRHKLLEHIKSFL